jgi:mannosyl-3-phosphoglycerate phosphatase
MKKVIIFTDLDGTLLDFHSYSFKKAQTALSFIKQKNIPLIICSSKTKKEIIYYRQKLDNDEPFIAENGGGIFIPDGFLDIELKDSGMPVLIEDGYQIVRLGLPYEMLRTGLKEIRREGFKIRGFGDMSAQEVSEKTGLSISEAAMAKERHFDEPFFYKGTKSETEQLIQAIHARGFRVTQGRLYHILGENDKGKAVSLLTNLYRKHFGEIVTIALGDSLNDKEMLEQADFPVIVQQPDKSYDERIQLQKITKAEGIGPEGWGKELLKLLTQLKIT